MRAHMTTENIHLYHYLASLKLTPWTLIIQYSAHTVRGCEDGKRPLRKRYLANAIHFSLTLIQTS